MSYLLFYIIALKSKVETLEGQLKELQFEIERLLGVIEELQYKNEKLNEDAESESLS